ncbi:hypothetical protein A2303_00375 [Candidatus Falkowbacteria bacterium RIFOXYB2_FULL_47_14]|uniref:Uncharacterized protein n=1 Tax=Candidatus Falkowbacteria bacterium RIFOXYA2_FULL_47_19 TaxID=1797994 RepID=A0A1F5SLW3_9BACT|nr:MAG: hypothetical protein A2227_03780 [Candidatus Falkowbacteria bacterium RIFOXYA2_FULL_47_19]OGF37330.1 MAG: hypothetical protein A2468_02140 [Candidatus Falkowbacteria bacterium RIFOXYC2_FULL_46_15]OGF42832.1 MAG: hypothetical protein A2303_00375 [Candidatus Falkowbacteria bacterium RIFOXYB2_FULL_47_14]
MTLTPEQFNKLATKDEFNELSNDLKDVKKGVGQLLTAMDAQRKKLDDIEHAFVSNQAAHDRFEKRLERIEKQLKLEPMFG